MICHLIAINLMTFAGGTALDLAAALDQGKGVVIAVNSDAPVPKFSFEYETPKDYDRLLKAKTGFQRHSDVAYAPKDYPSHILDFFTMQVGIPGPYVEPRDPWALVVVGKKWQISNLHGPVHSLVGFPAAFGGYEVSIPRFYQRLQVVVKEGIYEPKDFVRGVAEAVGGKMVVTKEGFEVVPDIAATRARMVETIEAKVTSTTARTPLERYLLTSLRLDAELLRVAPDSVIVELVQGLNSSEFKIEKSPKMKALIEDRVKAYIALGDGVRSTRPCAIEPSRFIETIDWTADITASLYTWPVMGGLDLWMKGRQMRAFF